MSIDGGKCRLMTAYVDRESVADYLCSPILGRRGPSSPEQVEWGVWSLG
jgi:hypothetical protein